MAGSEIKLKAGAKPGGKSEGSLGEAACKQEASGREAH